MTTRKLSGNRIIRRIGEREDAFVGSDGKSFDFPKFRVFEFLGQLIEEMLAPFLVVGEGQPQAFDRALGRTFGFR